VEGGTYARDRVVADQRDDTPTSPKAAEVPPHHQQQTMVTPARDRLDPDRPLSLGQVGQHPQQRRLLRGLAPQPRGAGARVRSIVDLQVRQPGLEHGERSVSLAELMAATQVKINVPGNHLMVGLLGTQDELLRLVENAFPDATLHVRGNEITVDGEHAEQVGRLFEELVTMLQQGHVLEPAAVARSIDMIKADERPSEVLSSEVLRSARGRSIRPKSSGQKRYIDAIRKNVVTFGIGPAGTGKSWLAVAMAVQALQSKQVERIILTRPAVEAGERLGFLPGDLMAKVDPYLRPLYDALYDMVEPDGAQRLLERGTVEVAPLAFMRGRTLNDSFIILDEAQNTTPEQMKMFLTRIGFNSKVVVTGDMTQVDVQGGRSGLVGLERVLSTIDGLAFVHLTSRDVVRHKIVQDIVDAYTIAEDADG
jgi:phosphate starvation-inducible PhoH-like protein